MATMSQNAFPIPAGRGGKSKDQLLLARQPRAEPDQHAVSGQPQTPLSSRARARQRAHAWRTRRV